MTHVGRSGLCVVIASYWVTEESGGPGVAAAGFARELSRLGVDVVLVALDHPAGTWLVSDRLAAHEGYRFVKVAFDPFPLRVVRMANLLQKVVESSAAPALIWVNGIWGPQSLAACVAARRTRAPFVLRPAGSLGQAALRRKRLKKWLYYRAIESRIARRAAAIHCLTSREVEELPSELRARAFVVPSGVDVATVSGVRRDPNLIGVLARIHPIKNHALALDTVERMIARGRDLRVEFAGSTSDAECERALRSRVHASVLLRDRVHFLGHVPHERLSVVVARWRAALLLSEQENFGHAVISAAALGVPSVVSTGVGLGPELEAAGAGIVAQRGMAVQALDRLLALDPGESASAAFRFAQRFRWEACGRGLLGHLEPLAATGVILGRSTGPR